MAFKGFGGNTGRKRGRIALSPWVGGENSELRFYVNHPDCKAKIWFVRDEDNDWVLKKWDEDPSEYPDFARDHAEYAPHEAVALAVINKLFGPLNAEKAAEQVGNVLDSEETKHRAKQELSSEEVVEDDPLPDF